jgi:hypothetical protein
MNAEEVLALIRAMEPKEIERLFVLVREYETEVRRRKAATRYAKPKDFKRIIDRVFTENASLFRKLAKLEQREKKERLRSLGSP